MPEGMQTGGGSYTKVIRRGGVGRENRLLGQGRPLKLWGDSKCKGLKAAARLSG